MKVLVVDDYSTMRRIIRNLLTQIGYTDIDEASDGGDALQKLRAVHYGLVISDWNMEPMTGYDLLKQVRADDKLKTTPFIMVTAESKTDNVIAAKKAGVDNYIVKPFNAATLQQKINGVMTPAKPNCGTRPCQHCHSNNPRITSTRSKEPFSKHPVDRPSCTNSPVGSVRMTPTAS
jgi:two-component system chemotaxis response regulator CheY